jgi:hypothetical protein
LPGYVRLLGFRKEREPMLRRFRGSGLPVVSKAANGPLCDAGYRLDAQAYDMWALGAKIPAGLMFRQPIQIIAP